MNASVLDLRRRMREILRALDRREPVTILHRGKKKGVLYPAAGPEHRGGSVREHPAFGMWKDRADLRNVEKAVSELRKGRAHGI